MRSFEGNLPDIYKSITEVASTVAGQMGCGDLDIETLMKNLVESQQGGSSVDAAQVLQRVGALLAPGGQAYGPSGGLPANLMQGMLGSLMSGGNINMPPAAMLEELSREFEGRNGKRASHNKKNKSLKDRQPKQVTY